MEPLSMMFGGLCEECDRVIGHLRALRPRVMRIRHTPFLDRGSLAAYAG